MRQIPNGGAATRVAFLGAVIGTALLFTLSCSDATGPGNNGGISSDGLTVDESRIVSVAVTVNPTTIGVGDSAQATANLVDRSGGIVGHQVNWSSSDQTVAMVSASGVVTALKIGSTVITGSRARQSGSATLTVVAASGPGATSTSVASVSVSPPTASVAAGGTQLLTATVRDSSGTVLTDRAVSWASSNSGVATVSASGMVGAVSAGTATITATSEGVAGTANITVTATSPPPPPPTGGAPEPTDGGVVGWQDNFDGSNPLGSYAKRGVIQLISDGHSGQGVRFVYTPGSPDNLIEKVFPTQTDGYYRFWFRVSKGSLPYSDHSGSGMKWFMLWRETTYVRYTMGVGKLLDPWFQFTSHDNSSTDQPVLGCPQNVSLTPKYDTTNDGNWHKYTVRVKTTAPAGEQIWIDDILVLDNFAKNYTHNPDGIAMVQFPGVVVDGIPDDAHSFNIDVDDLAIWHK